MFDTNMYGKRFVLRTFALYFPRLLPINDVQKLYQVIRWTVVRKRSPKYVPLHSIKSFGNIQTYYPNRYSSIRSFVQKHVGSKQKFFQWGTLTETYGNHRKPRYSSGWWDSKIGSIQASIMKTTAIKHTYVGFGPKVGSLQSLHLFRKHLKYWFWRACRYVPVRSKMLNNGKSLSGIHLEHATTVQSPNLFYQQPFLCSCRGLQFEGLVRPITQVKPSGGWGGLPWNNSANMCPNSSTFDGWGVWFPKIRRGICRIFLCLGVLLTCEPSEWWTKKTLSDLQHLQGSAFPTSTDRKRSKDQFLCFLLSPFAVNTSCKCCTCTCLHLFVSSNPKPVHIVPDLCSERFGLIAPKTDHPEKKSFAFSFLRDLKWSAPSQRLILIWTLTSIQRKTNLWFFIRAVSLV